jgi:hypothetical protein
MEAWKGTSANSSSRSRKRSDRPWRRSLRPGSPGDPGGLSVSESESVALSTEEAERFLRRAQSLRERAVAYAQPEDDEFAA